MSFTTAVREELAHTASPRPCCPRAEAGVLLRLAGSYRRAGGTVGVGYAMASASAAVVRRVRGVLQELGAVSELHVMQPSGLQGLTYQLHLPPPAEGALRALGLLDEEGHPPAGLLAGRARRPCDEAAALRGALLATGRVSTPRQEPHLEVGAPGPHCAEELADLLRACGAPGAAAGEHQGEWRVVVKSSAQIAVLLARAGAHAGFLRWDHERLHRELRRDATRSANADRANVSRVVDAAARQVAAVERALAVADWDALGEDLREVALARLANPEASLAELGALLDPPVGKSTVHRRLARLASAADGGAGPAG